MRKRTAAMVSAFALMMAVALPASAHSGYISCASSYNANTYSNSSTNSGIHTHNLHGQVSAWLAKGHTWNNWWLDDGFWGASAPGVHTGWATCE